MPSNTKAIKSKIKSVSNTKKITRAMEMISAVKMRKSITRSINSQIYAKEVEDITAKVIEKNNKAKTKIENDKNILFVVVGSTKGLCGSFNSNLRIKLRDFIIENQINKDLCNVIAINNKAAKISVQLGIQVKSIYSNINENTSLEEISVIANQLIVEMRLGKFSKAFIIYNKFVNSINQFSEVYEYMDRSELASKKIKKTDMYLIEPKSNKFANHLEQLKKQAILYKIISDSAASEHSSRMVAMKNATDSARDLISNLTLEYNKSRQAAITQEISEITNSADAI